ncbi:MAG: prepilin peptidase [Planctomycetes bacterium]|nr:prepilin peptidase [Planctomycetota bacterium]
MEQLNLEGVIIQLWVFTIGAVIGSFLNVCIYRIPERVSLLWPGSSCVNCNTSIAWYDNVPIVSFFVLRGKCRHCGHKISSGYPAVECITGVAFLLLLYSFPLAGNSLCVFFVFAFFCCLLIVSSFVDLKLHIIPNEVSYTGLAFVPVASLLCPKIHILCGSLRYSGESRLIHSVLISLIGMLVGGGLIYCCVFMGKVVFRKDAMGFGDVKLMGVIGGFLGWKLAITTFFLAPFFGLLFAIPKLVYQKERVIPYGPFLSLAAFVCLLYRGFFLGIIDNYIETFAYLFGIL